MSKVHVQGDRLTHQEGPQTICCLQRPAAPLASRCPRLPCLSQQAVRDFVEDVIFVSDVAVEAHRRHTEFGCQTADGHLVRTPLAHSLCCDVDYLLPRDAAPGGSSLPSSLPPCSGCPSFHDLENTQKGTCTNPSTGYMYARPDIPGLEKGGIAVSWIWVGVWTLAFVIPPESSRHAFWPSFARAGGVPAGSLPPVLRGKPTRPTDFAGSALLSGSRHEFGSSRADVDQSP